MGPGVDGQWEGSCLMDNQKFKGVLIGGLPSSGSTLLSLMLDSHPELICGPELTIFSHSLLWNPKKLTENNALLAWFSNNKCDGVIPWSKIDEKNLAFYHTERSEIINLVNSCDNLFELGDKLYAKKMKEVGASKWIEKTPQNIYALNAYLQVNRKATAIMTIRDPRAVIDSLMRRNISPEIASRVWVIEASIIHALITDPTINSRLYLLRYENLISDTEEVLQELCQFIHIYKDVYQMTNREKSERAMNDPSLFPTKGTAAYTWLCSPLDDISDKPLYAWKERLCANVYDALLHTSLERTSVDKYVKTPGLLKVTELMDYFGYHFQISHKESSSEYEEFFLNKVRLESKFEPRTNKQKWPLLEYTVYELVKIVCGRMIFKVMYHLKRNKIVQYYKAPIKQIIRQIIQFLLIVKSSYELIVPKYNKNYQWFEPKELLVSCDIAVVIAFSGRHGILQAVVNEAFKAENLGLDIAIVLSCTNDEDVSYAKQMQLKYKKIGIVQCDNYPLGNKWYIAVDCAKKFSPKAVMITGSDDIVSADYLKNNYQHLMTDKLKAFGMIAPRVWYMLDCKGKIMNTILWKVAYRNDCHHLPLGAGRIYSAEYLDSINWQIFDRNLDSLLDDKGFVQVLESELCVYSPTLDDGMVISVKGFWVTMNSLEVILAAESIVPIQVTGKEKEDVIEKVSDSLKLMNGKY